MSFLFRLRREVPRLKYTLVISTIGERTGALNPTQGGILSSNKHDFVGGQHSCTVQNQKTKQVLCLVTDNLECFYGASARLKKKN